MEVFLNKRKVGILVLFFALFKANTANAARPAMLYISQVQITGGKDNTSQDFIELFNPNISVVNLKGYRLVKRAGTASADTLIKAWSKDAIIPPRSFYLWANSSYTSILVKPDIATSATLSDDNGVALRFGENNTGTIIDSLAWGKTKNGFNNLSGANAGPGQALIRKDFSISSSEYFIGSSSPRNSKVNDLSAAFAASQNQPVKPIISTAKDSKKQPVLAEKPPAQPEPKVLGETAAVASSAPNPTPPAVHTNSSNQSPSHTSQASKYLFLALGALSALGFLAYKFFPKKVK